MGSKRLTELQRQQRDQARCSEEAFRRVIAEEFPVGTVVIPEHLDGGKMGTVIGHRYDKVLVCWHAKAEEESWDLLKLAPSQGPTS